ncbi:Subtilisin-like serine protease [Xanthomonas arboricola]|nr:Subtilisin-like serine protease [Xanthomonas arboricola]
MALALGSLLPSGAIAQSRPAIEGTILREVYRPQATAPEAVPGQRFIVKTRTVALKDKKVLGDLLSQASGRAGLTRPLAATASTPARAAASVRVLRNMASPGWHVVQASRRLSAAETAAFVQEVAADPGVQSVQVDRMYQRMDAGRAASAVPTAAPNDPNYAALQWNFNNAVGGVGAERAWTRATGAGAVVAVVDTGIVQNTVDLAANVLPGYDMISDRRVSRRDVDGRVPGGWDLGDWTEAGYCAEISGSSEASASSWHGTHVSGTIAQQTNNNIGLAGLAYDARVVPVRVLGSCGGYSSDIADGILWAAGAQVEGLPVNPNPAEVINMSLGSGAAESCPTVYQDAIDQANKLGSIIVVAAGNSNANAGSYTMGSCSGVIVVGASRITGGKASYSSWGARVDVAAPGGGGSVDGDPGGYIFQTIDQGEQGPTGTFTLGGYSGTSMASPHVAAAVALVQSVAKTPFTWTQMRDLLKESARPFPVGIPSSTPIGTGILDLETLLDLAGQAQCDPNVETCEVVARALTNKVSLSGLGKAAGTTLYSFQAEAGKPLTFMSFGGTGDVSMYAAAGRTPSSSSYDAKSTRSGNTETIRFTAPVAGTYYLVLSGTYADLTLVARQ